MLPVKSITVSQVLSILSLALFLSACAGKSNNDEVIKSLEESLKSSTKSIQISSRANLKSLEEKTTEYVTVDRATIWFPKAKQIAKMSSDVYNYINKLKELKKIDLADAKNLFITLLKYKEDIISIDSSIWVELKEYLLPFFDSYRTSENTGNSFYARFFKNSTPFQTSGILTKFQNDIAISENIITTFCNVKVGQLDGLGFFESYSAIVGQNSTILKPGDELEIKAGIGLFSYAARPKININGTNIELGEEGYSLFKTKVQKNPGKYKIPVSISFFNQTTGKEESMRVNVEYAVAKECN